MHSLVFCPRRRGQYSFESDTLIAALRSAGLIGNNLPGTETDYYTGERFLDLMVFMGCSPSIRLQPDADGGNYSYISFHHTPEPGRIYCGPLSRPATCKQCKSPLDTSHLYECMEKQILPACANCGTQLDWSEINWNKTIGLTSDAILIHNVFPHEAVPSDELINTICKASGTDWRYFYI